MDFKKDYYAILGITRNSSAEEIRAAFRRLAKLYHPDRNPDGDPARMQEINEAWEVLGELSQKAIYDQYYDSIRAETNKQRSTKDERRAGGSKAAQQGGASAKQKTGSTEQNAASEPDEKSEEKGRRKYKKTYTASETEKVYLKGRIQVKFCADALAENGHYLHMVDYRLYPTEVVIKVKERDLGIREPLPDWNECIREADLFKTPLSQPIRCEVINDEGTLIYNLNLKEIRVAQVELTDITKDEEKSYGTLLGDVYAELHHIRYEERSEWVTECYGPTGKEETKTEDDWIWKRAEYYYPDCTTFWSDWQKVAPVKDPARRFAAAGYTSSGAATAGGKFASTSAKKNGSGNWKNWVGTSSGKNEENQEAFTGCGSIILGIIFLFYIFSILAAAPSLLVTLVAFVVVILVMMVLHLIRRIIPMLYRMGVSVLIFASLWSLLRSHQVAPVIPRQSHLDTVVTEQIPQAIDTLRIHTVQWRGYDSNLYRVKLMLRLSDLRASEKNHDRINRIPFNSLSQVYESMARQDEASLDLVVSSFDSLRQMYPMGQREFAEVLISCIQSIPYYLVLHESCGIRQNMDPFVRDYLAQCHTDCCVGNIGYGVRAPLEFLSDLKGDCDTRALLLFTLLNRFGYDVALITSERYRHAAIAVGLDESIDVAGTAINVRGKVLYPCETTSSGFRIGELPREVSNLHHWQISLLSIKP